MSVTFVHFSLVLCCHSFLFAMDLGIFSNVTILCTGDGRSGTFVIGNDHFPVSLLELPCVVESYKTYDDSSLVKTADIGQVRAFIN